MIVWQVPLALVVNGCGNRP